MTSEANQPDQPLRTFPAHYSVAVLAAFGAVALQFAWPKILGRPLHASWWPLDAILVVAATSYMLATAWAHFKAAAWRPDQAVPRIWRLATGLPGELLLMALTIVLFVRGPETSVLRSGLALLLPVLLAVLAASVTVAVISLQGTFRRCARTLSPRTLPRAARNSTRFDRCWALPC